MPSPSSDQWRCFQCGAVIADPVAAAAHFGFRSSDPPLCSAGALGAELEMLRADRLRVQHSLDVALVHALDVATPDSPLIRALDAAMSRRAVSGDRAETLPGLPERILMAEVLTDAAGLARDRGFATVLVQELIDLAHRVRRCLYTPGIDAPMALAFSAAADDQQENTQ